MRSIRLATLSVCVLTACGEAGTGNAAQDTAQASAAPTVSVTPNEGLGSEELVNVQASGLRGNREFMVVQCREPLVNANDCNQYMPVTVTSTPTGTLSASLNVQRGFTVGGTYQVCLDTGRCSVGVVQLPERTVVARADIDFRELQPSVTVSPATGLADQQAVNITGTEIIHPFYSDPILIGQCRADVNLGFGSLYLPSGCLQKATARQENSNISATITVDARLQFSATESFSCEAPGACIIAVKPLFSFQAAAIAPISFRTMGTPQRGVASVTSSPVPAGGNVTVTGSGWAPQSTVSIRACPRGVEPSLCSVAQNVPLGPDGTFTTSVTVQRTIDYSNGLGFADCTAADACLITVHDARDPAGTAASAPYRVEQVPAQTGTAHIDMPVALVDGLPVRISGAGWAAGQQLRVRHCLGQDFLRCQSLADVSASTTGAFRLYRELNSRLFFADALSCASPGACALVVFDPNAPTATQVRIPLTFSTATQFEVTSHYEPELEALFQQGVSLSGWTPGQLQKQGAAITAYVLSIAGAATGAHFSTSGAHSHTSSYTLSEYLEYTRAAARFDYTLEELQKTGALFWSWILAGMPPFPVPAGE